MPDSPKEVFQIVYTAVSAHDLDGAGIEDMIVRSGGLRRRLRVTGLFGYLPRTGEMFEVLEGKREDVQAAFDTVRSDTRRAAVSVRYSGSTDRRQFASWRPCLSGIDAFKAIGDRVRTRSDDLPPPPARVLLELASEHI